MKFQLLCLSFLLTACPTPPDPNQSTKNNGPANVGGPNNNGGMQNNPGAPQGSPGNPGQAQGDGKGTPPPQGEENGADNLGAPPGSADNAPSQGTMAEMERTPPEDGQAEGDGSAMFIFYGEVEEGEVRYPQSEIKDSGKDYVTLSGSISCSGEGSDCGSDMFIQVTPFQKPTEDNNPLANPEKSTVTDEELLGTITTVEVKNDSDFEILVYKGDSRVVLGLVLDANGDGKTNEGEKFVIYEGGGGISLSENKKDIQFKFSPKNMNGPIGMPNPGTPGTP